ncbi:hypothetical protein [Candidatus Pantoea soli]|uniref:Uncharacterized protein n=1 Tax=Candidatus Pantoea soli TaxID=3098669 RepID=A0A518XJX8_9GAMM|nr:hypothetical protein [Pantoea soli]QDY44498.1 hypothetical protein D8B20_21470 [Pantoea soli]
MLDLIKTITSIPTAVNGIVAGRAAYKAHEQARKDLMTYMDIGMRKTNKILRNATKEQRVGAILEYRKWRIPKPNGVMDLEVRGKVPVNHVSELVGLKADIGAILALNTVFLPQRLRKRLINLNQTLKDTESSFEKRGKEWFYFARCYILRKQIRRVKALL